MVSVMKAKTMLNYYFYSACYRYILPSLQVIQIRLLAGIWYIPYCTFEQNDITAVTKEGKILLTNLKVPDPEEAINSRFEHHEQISGDWQTVNKWVLSFVYKVTYFILLKENYTFLLQSVKVFLDLWKFKNSFLSCLTEVHLLADYVLWTGMFFTWAKCYRLWLCL